MRNPIATLVLGGLLLVGPGLTAASLAQQAPSPQEFAQQVASANSFEIEAAKLTIERGKDPQAIQYAKDMLREHEQVSKDFMNAVKTDGLTISPALSDEHQKQLDALRTATEADFDQAYFSSQITTHENAVALLTSYAGSDNAGALKAFAENSLGTMRMHAIRAQDLAPR